MTLAAVADMADARPGTPAAHLALRILIVAEDASLKFGGEASLPYHWFRVLRNRGLDVWMIVNHRVKAELQDLLPPAELARVRFVPDTWVHKKIVRWTHRLPNRLTHFTTGLGLRLITQGYARAMARDLVRTQRIDVVHQPTPVSPKEVSLLEGLGAPVVMGPLNGGMVWPAAFASRQSRSIRGIVAVGRLVSDVPHWIAPGKLRAPTVVVANARTRQALPRGLEGAVVELVENGLDLTVWQHRGDGVDPAAKNGHLTFAFVGRLVDWKGVDLLLEAFARVVQAVPAHLRIIGEGQERPALEAQAQRLGLDGAVEFLGWRTQAQAAAELAGADAFVLPSLLECGGAVVLEAMAVGLPVIATNWGGPADYIDASCGILVEPSGREGFIAGLAAAMIRLGTDPGLRMQMAAAGRAKVVREYDWERKADRMLEVYADTVRRAGGRT